eukprot:TRINITY_DN114350_c0_g1_i1.p1 TRINITY_DN114350_c0_g1~~TRINITY_DN114350_c0_g1_i1.p1  ORF type:complete len:507 (-),score=14.40 TRINITY_DN114350_c0_g1_i1:187-1680(-)
MSSFSFSKTRKHRQPSTTLQPVISTKNALVEQSVPFQLHGNAGDSITVQLEKLPHDTLPEGYVDVTLLDDEFGKAHINICSLQEVREAEPEKNTLIVATKNRKEKGHPIFYAGVPIVEAPDRLVLRTTDGENVYIPATEILAKEWDYLRRPLLTIQLLADHDHVDTRAIVRYGTENIEWNSTLTVYVNSVTETVAHMKADVNVTNCCGVSFKNCAIRLVQQPPDDDTPSAKKTPLLVVNANANNEDEVQQEEDSITLATNYDLDDQADDGFRYLDLHNVNGTAALVCNASCGRQNGLQRTGAFNSSGSAVWTLLVANKPESGLGRWIPASTLRCFSTHGGEISQLKHTNLSAIEVGEEIAIPLRADKTVKFDKTQKVVKWEAQKCVCQETIQIAVTNNSGDVKEVVVEDKMSRWSNWTILSSSHTYTAKHDDIVAFSVRVVPTDKPTNIVYTVQYTWSGDGEGGERPSTDGDSSYDDSSKLTTGRTGGSRWFGSSRK